MDFRTADERLIDELEDENKRLREALENLLDAYDALDEAHDCCQGKDLPAATEARQALSTPSDQGNEEAT